MNLKKELFIPTIILLLLDFIYLYVNNRTFANQVLNIQKAPMQVRYGSIIVCYITLIFGLWYFIIRTHKSPIDAGILGLLIYSVYETTTYAIFKNWDIKLVLMDTAWGGILLYLTTIITYKVNSGK